MPRRLSPVETADDNGHQPVLLAEIVDALEPRDGGVYVDATFGAGGYSRALLQAATCRVVAIDRDPDAPGRATRLAEEFGERFQLAAGCFGDMAGLLAGLGIAAVDGIAFDLGVSSMQIDDPERGFSFRFDGPLDMRMGQSGESAAALVESLAEADLARLIRELGEERFARRIARAIVTARAVEPIRRTAALAAIVQSAVPKGEPGLHPATRTFQALRIAVNDELGELDRGLAAAERLLRPGGRVAIVSFHSLEDGRVKTFLRQRSEAAPQGSRHAPSLASAPPPLSFRLSVRRAIKPGDAETARNPRSRSARLRVAERTDAAPWPAAPHEAAFGAPHRNGPPRGGRRSQSSAGRSSR